MKRAFLILCIILCWKTSIAQKVTYNPDYISTNFPGKVTKVEQTGTETILHFSMKAPIGSRFLIAARTYIENSGEDTERLYIKKSEGVNISEWFQISHSGEVRYKLYFPALGRDVKKINYGESNPKGNWFIYKLDLIKNGRGFIKNSSEPMYANGERVFFGNKHIENDDYASTGERTMLPKDLPKAFFGNWYDKHGTLILITTPDYVVSNSRVQYYQNIKRTGNINFTIKTNRGSLEVLNIEGDIMTIRQDKLSTLKRKPSNNTILGFMKGEWLHWQRVKRITITDDYFYNDDRGSMGVYDVIKSRIDHVAISHSGDVIWFVLYREGNYQLYTARKTNGKYILTPRGYPGARYTKN
nr:hypothetical protein [uncultured Allomuricauda sp.]